MKRIITGRWVPCLVSTAMMFGALGCSRLKEIEASEFRHQIEINHMQTLYWSEFIGTADGKAFLLRKRSRFWGSGYAEEVLYADAEELEPGFLMQLEAAQEYDSEAIKGTD